jgi:hypothetical protein
MKLWKRKNIFPSPGIETQSLGHTFGSLSPHRVMLALAGNWHDIKLEVLNVRFEVVMAVTMKNVVFCDVTPCGFCKHRRSGRTYSSIFVILIMEVIRSSETSVFTSFLYDVTSNKTAFFMKIHFAMEEPAEFDLS